MTRISLIIPIFNALSYTKKCLQYLKESLSRTDKGKLSIFIIVVDDGSTDGSAEWIKINFPEVNICKGDGNLWWSGGVNMGIKYAIDELQCEYILLWNNDIRPSEDYFVRLTDILTSNPTGNIILSSIYVENRKDRIIFSKGGNFNPITGKHALIGFGQPEQEYKDPGLRINWFPGMGTVIPITIFDKIGFFDEKYFPQYKGDADFGLRAYDAGFKLVLSKELTLWNDRSNTGFSNDKSFNVFIKSLISRKSNVNIYRDFIFYKRHAKSVLAYRELLRKYTVHIGGFIKWKFLGIFGIKRKTKY